jgi:hypothetical protein
VRTEEPLVELIFSPFGGTLQALGSGVAKYKQL